MDDEVIKRAEKEIVEAAMTWAERRARNTAPLGDAEQRLYNAAVMLRSARRASRSFRIPVGKKVE